MKIEREFLNELNKINDVIFIEFFKNDKYLRKKLFEHYQKTELRPDLHLYYNQYFTDKEICSVIIQANEKIPESKNAVVMASSYSLTDGEIKLKNIESDFHKLNYENKLPQKYFSHSIILTPIYQQLSIVFQDFKDFEEEIFSKNRDKAKTYSKHFVKSIIKKLEKIQLPKLTDLVLNKFINNGENVTIDVECFYSNEHNGLRANLKSEYGKIKRFADNYIHEYLKKIEIPETSQFDNTTTLKEMFVYPETYDKCIDLLKNVDPPILNINNQYIGKEKGAFVLWIDTLKKNNLIERSPNDKLYAKLISKTFQPFSISSGTFRKVPKRAKERYEIDFNLLLSQVYHNVNL